MNILVLTPCYLPVIGGAETGLFEIYRRLSRRHNVHLITRHVKAEEFPEGDADPYYRCDRIHVIRYHRIEPGEWNPGFRFLSGIPMFAATAGIHALGFKPDIVHAHFISTCTGALSVLRRISKAPAVVSLVGRIDVLDETNPVYRQGRSAIDFALSRAARVIHLTDYMVGVRTQDSRYVKIPYGVNFVSTTREEIAAFRARVGIPPGAKVLLSLSRFENRTKRQDVIVDALIPLLRRHPDTVLLLAGEGPDRAQTMALVRELGLSNQILTPGFIPERDIPACLGAGTVFLFASKLETFGIVLAQAMAAGLPIVAMDSSCIAEVVRHGEFGWMVPDLNKDAMRAAAERLLNDEDLRNQMAARGRARAQTEFDWDAIASRHEQLFQSIVDEAGRHGGGA